MTDSLNKDVAKIVVKEYKPYAMKLIAQYAVFNNKSESWAKEVLALSLSLISKMIIDNKIILKRNNP